MSEMNRRDFVKAAAATLAACACLGCPISTDAMAGPPGATGGNVDVGKLSDYATDGTISDKFLKTNKMVVIRNDGKIYATSAICTHKSSQLRINGQELACPKHGSKFSINGTVTHGPAQNSLVRYEIKKNDAGHLIVNTNKPFRESHWDDPASFVPVT